MTTIEGQLPRFVLALRACGLAPAAVAAAALAFHPDANLPQDYAEVSPGDAAALLAEPCP
jgi:hypothetical protein